MKNLLELSLNGGKNKISFSLLRFSSSIAYVSSHQKIKKDLLRFFRDAVAKTQGLDKIMTDSDISDFFDPDLYFSDLVIDSDAIVISDQLDDSGKICNRSLKQKQSHASLNLDEVFSVISQIGIARSQRLDCCKRRALMNRLIKLQQLVILNRIKIGQPVSSRDLDSAVENFYRLIGPTDDEKARSQLEKNLSDLKSTFWSHQTLWGRGLYAIEKIWNWLTGFIFSKFFVSADSSLPETFHNAKPPKESHHVSCSFQGPVTNSLHR